MIRVNDDAADEDCTVDIDTIDTDARDLRYCGLYTVFLPFDSRVALSRRESVSTVRVCSAY